MTLRSFSKCDQVNIYTFITHLRYDMGEQQATKYPVHFQPTFARNYLMWDSLGETLTNFGEELPYVGQLRGNVNQLWRGITVCETV